MKKWAQTTAVTAAILTGSDHVEALAQQAPNVPAQAAPSAEKPPLDKNDKQTLAAVFDGIALTDQHGKTFDPAQVLRDGPAVVLFGYGGCPRCQEISKTVASLQQQLIDKGRKVPILVVSVQPDKDSKAMREYIARYHEMGVRQFQPQDEASKALPENAEERRKQAEAGFDAYEKKDDAGQKKEQAERIFHIVCPPKDEDAKTIQERISEGLKKAGSKNMLITSKTPKEHTSFMIVFNDGKAVEAYRALNPKQEAPPDFTKSRAGEVAAKIQSLGPSKAAAK